MYPEKPDNSKQKAVAGLVALIVIALLAGGAVLYSSSQNSQDSQTATQSSSSTPSSSASATASNSNYKDGTYTASTSYHVPPGTESIEVTLTVSNGTVTDSTVENSESDRESAEYQQEFESAYKQYVVGKPLSGLKLDYIAGASDTVRGFNNAVEQIQSEAQA